VLFGTGTFWEGIDVVGDQLSCVIIDRLPFPSPADPLVAARIAALEARGRSGFEAYMIPSAIVRLKQGFGRLIRLVLALGVAFIPNAVFAWGFVGHTMINRLAAQNLPDSLPAFVRSPDAIAEIATLGPEEDRIKGAGQSWDDDKDPGHYLDSATTAPSRVSCGSMRCRRYGGIRARAGWGKHGSVSHGLHALLDHRRLRTRA
jgi:hypothetical protein